MTGLLNGVKTNGIGVKSTSDSGWDMTGLLNGVKTKILPPHASSLLRWDMTGLLNGVKTPIAGTERRGRTALGYDRTFERG